MAKVQKNVQSTKENFVFLLFSNESILTDYTLTFSHCRPQPLMYKEFEEREGWTMSLTLPSHFGSHSFPSQNGVRARSEKSEGDVRENHLPSRAISPLCIGLWGLWCEKVRDICEFVVFLHSIAFVHRLFAITATKARAESDAFGLRVRRLRTRSPSARTKESNI